MLTALTLIQDASNEILISPASYWEIAIKISIGKWRLNRPHDAFIDIGLNQHGFRILPILPTHTARLIVLPFPAGHKGPFDGVLTRNKQCLRLGKGGTPSDAVR